MTEGMKSPADIHEMLVEYGLQLYHDLFVAGFKFLTEGGRYPGMAKPTQAELRAYFQSLPDEAWQAMAQQDPKGAQKAVQQYERLAVDPQTLQEPII